MCACVRAHVRVRAPRRVCVLRERKLEECVVHCVRCVTSITTHLSFYCFKHLKKLIVSQSCFSDAIQKSKEIFPS